MSNEWVKKGYFNTGFNGLDEDSGQARQILYRDEAAVHLMGSWFNSTVITEKPEYKNEKMGIVKFPRDEEGAGNPDTVIGTAGDNLYHVAASGKNPDKTFELITHFVDEEGTKDILAAGRIPSLKGITLEDPIGYQPGDIRLYPEPPGRGPAAPGCPGRIP